MRYKYQSPRMRVALARMDWTQSDLARAVGISESYLIDIMAGRRENPETVGRIAATLRIRPSDVIAGPNGPKLGRPFKQRKKGRTVPEDQ